MTLGHPQSGPLQITENLHMYNDKCRYVNVAGDWNPDGAKAAERWWVA